MLSGQARRLRFRLARAAHGFWRFRFLRSANRLFGKLEQPLLLSRPFAGHRLFLDVSRSAFQQLLYLQGESLCHERFLLSGLLQAGMRVVDVGANIGYYLLLFERAVGIGGEVICIEPSPENLVELKANIEFNALRNVRLFECAVGAAKGTVGLKSGINGGVVPLETGAFVSAIHRLDSLIDQHVDFLKIDVEGYEGQVLEGAEGIIRRDRPILFLEYHPQLVTAHGHCFQDILAFLSRYYKNIEYFDVAERSSFTEKVLTRYLNRDAVRRIDVSGIPELQMHIGRLFGTFWMVGRP